MKCPTESLITVTSQSSLSGIDGVRNEPKSWKGLFKNILADQGMKLRYFPLEIKEGKALVRITAEEMKKVEINWEYAFVLFFIDLALDVLNIRRYDKAVWPLVKFRRIVKHKEKASCGEKMGCWI